MEGDGLGVVNAQRSVQMTRMECTPETGAVLLTGTAPVNSVKI